MRKYINAEKVEQFFVTSGKIMVILFLGIVAPLFVILMMLLFDNTRTILQFCGVTIATLYVLFSCVVFAAHCDNERKNEEKEKS